MRAVQAAFSVMTPLLLLPPPPLLCRLCMARPAPPPLLPCAGAPAHAPTDVNAAPRKHVCQPLKPPLKTTLSGALPAITLKDKPFFHMYNCLPVKE